jgi:DNA polymerase-3 subunit delta
MSEIKASQLLKEFNLSQLKPVLIIYGDEYLTKALVVEKFKSVLPIKVYWGDELDYTSFRNHLFSKDLFSSSKAIVVRDFEAFTDKLKKDELKQIVEDIKNIKLPDRLILVVNLEKLEEPYKSLLKLDNVDVVISKKLTFQGFLTSLKNKLTKEGKAISDENLKYLASLLNNDLTIAKNEVEKLLLYVGDKKEITKEDIDAVVTPVFEENVFNFLDKFFKKDISALKIFINLLNNGVHPFEIQSLILSQLEKALQTKILIEAGNSLEEALNKAGISHPLQKSNISNILKSLSKEEMVKLLNNLYNLEVAQKIYYQDINETSKEFILNFVRS